MLGNAYPVLRGRGNARRIVDEGGFPILEHGLGGLFLEAAIGLTGALVVCSTLGFEIIVFGFVRYQRAFINAAVDHDRRCFPLFSYFNRRAAIARAMSMHDNHGVRIILNLIPIAFLRYGRVLAR